MIRLEKLYIINKGLIGEENSRICTGFVRTLDAYKIS